MQTRGFPLLGTAKAEAAEVFRVVYAGDMVTGGVSQRLAGLLDSRGTLFTREAVYDGTEHFRQHSDGTLTVLFHTVVFAHVAEGNEKEIYAGIYTHENEFSQKVVSPIEEGIACNVYDWSDYRMRGKTIRLEPTGGDCTFALRTKGTDLRVNVAFPVAVFTSVVKFQEKGQWIYYVTRHFVIVSNTANLSQSLCAGRYHELLLSLQSQVVNLNATYGYEGEFPSKLSALLIGTGASSEAAKDLTALMHYLLWERNGKPQQVDYGSEYYKTLITTYAETADSEQETARLQLASLWTAAIREVVDYYLQS